MTFLPCSSLRLHSPGRFDPNLYFYFLKNYMLMKGRFILLFCLVLMVMARSCRNSTSDPVAEKTRIDTLLNQWHAAAARADLKIYFDFFSPDAVFIGTDASEHWDRKAFYTFSKPYFDRGRAWTFKAVDRHIYFGREGHTAWFDELLSTKMKICRGSGVLEKEYGQWKIKQYVLSMTIPNSKTDSVVRIKSGPEDELLRKMLK